MDQARPVSAGNTSLVADRRNGPSDRRRMPRGGRRHGDIIASGLVLSAMLVTGCADNEKLSPVAPSSLKSEVRTEASAAAKSTLLVGPHDAVLVAGQTLQYVAEGSKGLVRWKATGGTITSSGLFTAGTIAGTFTVTASTNPQGSSSANVTITLPAPSDGGTDGGGTGGGGTGGDTGGTSGGGTIAGTVINPGDSIQNAVNANPEGTTFVIKTGVHRRQSVIPKSGMTFAGEPGAVLDGENATARAFYGSSASRVTIRGLRITNYAPPNTGAAIDAQDTTGWLVEDNEIDHNSNGSNRTYGLRLGSDMIARNNRIHHNGWDGISGYKAVGTIVEGNEIHFNPPATFSDTIGEAANMKCYDCGSLIVRNNYVHDGPLRGIWVDRSRPDITIENNRVINHGEAGIWYEVSYRGTIQGNYVDNAGYASYYSGGWLRGGGIQVTNSPGVSVLNNTVVNSLNGIIGLQASSYYNGPYGASELRNLLVQGNTVLMSRGQNGIAENINNTAVFDGWNNRFAGNTYQIGTIVTPFYWKGQNLTLLQWKAGPGALDN